MSYIPTLKDGTQFACDEIIREQDKEIEHLRATELAHASTITELSLKVGDLQTQLAAKDAVMEAARFHTQDHDGILGHECQCPLCVPLRALDAAKGDGDE